MFPALATLWLGNNRISSWRSLDALSALPALRELRLSGNPVLQGPEGEARFEVDSATVHYECEMYPMLGLTLGGLPLVYGVCDTWQNVHVSHLCSDVAAL